MRGEGGYLWGEDYTLGLKHQHRKSTIMAGKVLLKSTKYNNHTVIILIVQDVKLKEYFEFDKCRSVSTCKCNCGFLVVGRTI